MYMKIWFMPPNAYSWGGRYGRPNNLYLLCDL